MNNIIKRTWNQNRMVNIEDLRGMAFQAESGGHTFEISGIDDQNNAVGLSGTVAGVFMRPDGTDVALTGTASDGVVSVTLSDACYAIPGRFALTIFVTSDGQKTAVYAAIGTVSRTSGGAVAGDTPQDVVDLINQIQAAVASIPADYTDLMAAIAPNYSPSALYAFGSYAWDNGNLYRCTTAITTAETWTAAHWVAAVIGKDVADLKSAIYADESVTKTNQFTTTAGTSINAATKKITNLGIASGQTFTVKISAPVGTFGPLFLYKFNDSDVRSLLMNFASENTEYTFTASENITALSIYASPANVLLSSNCEIVVKIIHTNQDSIEARLTNIETDINAMSGNANLLSNLLCERIKDRFVCNIGATYNTFDTIPSQSLFDIERASRLGFSAIELNVLATSDGKFITTHGLGGKFGNAFTSLDESDIANTLVNSVTLDYIKTNVRYKSTLDKYKVAPPTLEETLTACHKFGIVPAIQYVDGVIDIADEIIGKNRYILNIYTANRPSGYSGVCSSWLTIADEDDLLAKCEASGGAYIAGLNVTNAAYSSFDYDDWKSMFRKLHDNGYRVMSAYVNNPTLMTTLVKAGLDYIFSSYQVPDIVSGNLCNLTEDVTWTDFTTTGAVADNVVTLSANQTIKPSETYSSIFLGRGAIHVRFNGSIKVTMGNFINAAYTLTSDGTEDIFLSTYFDREAPSFTITAVESTTVYNLTYKADKC